MASRGPSPEQAPRRPGARARRRAAWVFGAVALFALALALAWRFTGLAEWADPDRLEAWLAAFRGSPWRIPVVWALFVVGGLLVVPINLLFLGTGLAFPFGEAVALSLSGGLVAGAVQHGIGRRLDLGALLAHAPSGLRRRVEGGLERAGLHELVVLRLLPLGPYTTMNLLWGAAGVDRGRMLLASAIGLAPAATLTAMIGSGLRSGLAPRSLLLVSGGVLGLLALGILGLRRMR